MTIHGLRAEFQPSNFAKTSLPTQKTDKTAEIIKPTIAKNVSLTGLGQNIDTKS